MRNLTHRWPQSGHFFPNLGYFFFQFLKKGQRRLFSLLPLVTRLSVQSVLPICKTNCTSNMSEVRGHNHLVRKRTLIHLTKLSVWLNGRVFVYELSGCSHLNKSLDIHKIIVYRVTLNAYVAWQNHTTNLGLSNGYRLSCSPKILTITKRELNLKSYFSCLL